MIPLFPYQYIRMDPTVDRYLVIKNIERFVSMATNILISQKSKTKLFNMDLFFVTLDIST